jgi:hypothetical protein
MGVCHETPEGDESDDSTCLSIHQNQSTLAGDVNGHAQAQASDRQKDFERASYNHLARSLELDTAFVSILDPPFDAHQIPGSAMDTGKPREVTRGHFAAKSEEADTDSWTRLVVEGCHPPPVFFDTSSTGLDLPDLVSLSEIIKSTKSWGVMTEQLHPFTQLRTDPMQQKYRESLALKQCLI